MLSGIFKIKAHPEKPIVELLYSWKKINLFHKFSMKIITAFVLAVWIWSTYFCRFKYFLMRKLFRSPNYEQLKYKCQTILYQAVLIILVLYDIVIHFSSYSNFRMHLILVLALVFMALLDLFWWHRFSKLFLNLLEPLVCSSVPYQASCIYYHPLMFFLCPRTPVLISPNSKQHSSVLPAIVYGYPHSAADNPGISSPPRGQGYTDYIPLSVLYYEG